MRVILSRHGDAMKAVTEKRTTAQKRNETWVETEQRWNPAYKRESKWNLMKAGRKNNIKSKVTKRQTGNYKEINL